MDTFSNSERREKIRYVEWWVGSGGDRWLSCKYYSRPRYRTISWLIRFRWISTSHTTDIESLYDEITCRLICPANVHLYNISQIRAIVIRLFTTACPIGHSMHPPLPLFPTRVLCTDIRMRTYILGAARSVRRTCNAIHSFTMSRSGNFAI